MLIKKHLFREKEETEGKWTADWEGRRAALGVIVQIALIFEPVLGQAQIICHVWFLLHSLSNDLFFPY